VSVSNAESHVAPENGKQVLRLAPVGGHRKGSNVGMALVAGVLRSGLLPAFRFRSADAVERSHAVQDVAWPEHT
jgi:hypothetical protein